MIVQKIALAKNYAYLNESDSAILLLNAVKSIVETSNDVELRAIYYKALAEMEATTENYESSFFYQKKYITCVDSVYQLQRKSSLAEAEQIYNYLRFQDENKMLRTTHIQIIKFVCVLVGLLIIAFILIGWIIRKKKQALSNAEETIETLRKMQEESSNSLENKDVDHEKISDYSDKEKERIVKKALLMQLNIAKMLAKLDENSDKDKTFLEKFNRLYHGEQQTTTVNWKELYLLIDLLYDDFTSKLQSCYTTVLLEKEIQLCCLLKANMDTTEIACVMGQSINTVRTRKTNIRKKLGVQDAANIIVDLDRRLKDKR